MLSRRAWRKPVVPLARSIYHAQDFLIPELSQRVNDPGGEGFQGQDHSTALMLTYVINLDSAPDRWAHMAESFARNGMEVIRVPAVAASALQSPDPAEYSDRGYRWLHGRHSTPQEIGCYLSHVKAFRAFLETDAAHALICEDDLTFGDGLHEVIAAALRESKRWNILRLTGLPSKRSRALKVGKLLGGYSLGVHMGRMKGTGAYLIDRQGARALADGLLPMRLPYDHAFDREWFYGLMSASVLPFPISQTDSPFESSMQHNKRKVFPLQRYATTYPYQAFNEVTRWLFRFGYYLALKLRLK